MRRAPLSAAIILMFAAAATRPAAGQNAALLTTAGTDTFCFERYARRGNVITGSWVVMHPPGVYVHEYRIVLGPDGLPLHYRMIYREPTSAARPDLDSVLVDYGRDTVTYRFIGRDSTLTQRVALHEAFPFLGQSMVGLDLAMRRMRATHTDSAMITAAETSNLVTPPRELTVRLAGDTAIVGKSTHVQIAHDGGFVAMSDGRRVVRSAPSLDVDQLTKHFVDEFARKR